MPDYSFKNPDIADGSVIDEGNFTQLLPNTEIMKNKALTINGGNFTNVKQQPVWTINGGNWAQIDKCSHLNPVLIEFGLPECGVECRHLKSKEEINIDGELIDTIFTYEDIRL